MPIYKLNIPEGFQKVKLPGLNKWVEALKSGEYKQRKGVLCFEDGYCCLGVLSKQQGRLRELPLGFTDDVSVEEGESYVSLYGGLSFKNPLYEILGWNGELPKGCSVDIYKEELNPINYTQLAPCNDEGLTFLEIADILEKVFEE